MNFPKLSQTRKIGKMFFVQILSISNFNWTTFCNIKNLKFLIIIKVIILSKMIKIILISNNKMAKLVISQDIMSGVEFDNITSKILSFTEGKGTGVVIIMISQNDYQKMRNHSEKLDQRGNGIKFDLIGYQKNTIIN
jgi:hypothetical protein